MNGSLSKAKNKEAIVTKFLDTVIMQDGCWGWKGYRGRFGGTGKPGYPVFVRETMRYLCHRLAWEIFKGPIPEGMDVLHTCDNPVCTNPEHLFLGTQADNNRDRHAKGRSVIPDSENHGMAKWKNLEVQFLRELKADGVSIPELANWFNASQWTIRRIVFGQGYPNAPGPISPPGKRGPKLGSKFKPRKPKCETKTS